MWKWSYSSTYLILAPDGGILYSCNVIFLSFCVSSLHFNSVVHPFFQVAGHIKQISEDEPQIPQNPLKAVHTASAQPENGKIYDKKPFRMKFQKGKAYFWCLCGQSKSQVLN